MRFGVGIHAGLAGVSRAHFARSGHVRSGLGRSSHVRSSHVQPSFHVVPVDATDRHGTVSRLCLALCMDLAHFRRHRRHSSQSTQARRRDNFPGYRRRRNHTRLCRRHRALARAHALVLVHRCWHSCIGHHCNTQTPQSTARHLTQTISNRNPNPSPNLSPKRKPQSIHPPSRQSYAYNQCPRWRSCQRCGESSSACLGSLRQTCNNPEQRRSPRMESASPKTKTNSNPARNTNWLALTNCSP